VKKFSSRGKLGVKGGKFALASGEVTNNREKAREVYCPQDFFSAGLGRCSLDHLDLELYCDVAL